MVIQRSLFYQLHQSCALIRKLESIAQKCNTKNNRENEPSILLYPGDRGTLLQGVNTRVEKNVYSVCQSIFKVHDQNRNATAFCGLTYVKQRPLLIILILACLQKHQNCTQKHLRIKNFQWRVNAIQEELYVVTHPITSLGFCCIVTSFKWICFVFEGFLRGCHLMLIVLFLKNRRGLISDRTICLTPMGFSTKLGPDFILD